MGEACGGDGAAGGSIFHHVFSPCLILCFPGIHFSRLTYEACQGPQFSEA